MAQHFLMLLDAGGECGTSGAASTMELPSGQARHSTIVQYNQPQLAAMTNTDAAATAFEPVRTLAGLHVPVSLESGVGVTLSTGDDVGPLVWGGW